MRKRILDFEFGRERYIYIYIHVAGDIVLSQQYAFKELLV